MFSRFTRSTLKLFGQPKVFNTMQDQSLTPFKDHAIPHVTMVQEPEYRFDGTYTSWIDSIINIGIYRGKYKDGKPYFLIQSEDESLEIKQEVTKTDEEEARYIQRIR